MAPTFRPYQSVGQGLNRLNLPEGAEAREAQRTMTVLSQSLDRMSNFFFNKAEEEAAIEGEKFGIENMSLQKLKDANKRNEDIFDVPEFGNTVFGKAARASALTVLENEILLDYNSSISDLVFNANQSGTNPTVLRNQIDATIKGYVDALKPSVPVLAKKIEGKLTLQGANEFDNYRTAHAKEVAKNLTATNITALNLQINTLDGPLNKFYNDGTLTQKSFSTLRDDFAKLLDNPAAGLGLSDTEKKAYIKQIDDKFASFVQAKVFAIAMDKTKPMAFLNSLLDPDNPKTTGNETLDKLLKSPMFDLERKSGIFTEIKKEIRDLRTEENLEETRLEKELPNKANAVTRQFNKFLYGIGNNGLADVTNALKQIEEMNKLDPSKVPAMEKKLADLKGGLRARSNFNNPNVITFVEKLNAGQADYQDLENVADLLSQQDLENYDAQLDKITDEKFKNAQATLVGELGYSPEAKLAEKALEETETRAQAYRLAYAELLEKASDAKRLNQDIDLNLEAKKIAKKYIDDFDIKLDKMNRKKIANNVRRKIEALKSSGVTNVPEVNAQDPSVALQFVIDYMITNKTNKEALANFGAGLINQRNVQNNIDALRLDLDRLGDD
tara:strand:- start:1131 stop:2972 length:1842 start_codon:yes stop_codon:yes gene_type:complete